MTADHHERTSPRPRCRSLTGVRVVGTGSYVPDGVVTNGHLFQKFGFDSDWIVKRTGIYERRHALPHQATSDLCHEASLRCIESAGVRKQDIDLIVLATFTPDMSFPSTACLLQDRLKLSCAAIDVLHIPRNRVYNNLDRYGNTSAGSVPLALDEAVAEGRVRPGNLVVLSGFGAGLAWGTAVMRW